MTFALRGPCFLAVDALAAQMARKIALTALAVLELSTYPFHDALHAHGLCVTPSCSLCAAKERHLGITRCAQIGDSGASSAGLLKYLARYPHRVRRLLMLS